MSNKILDNFSKEDLFYFLEEVLNLDKVEDIDNLILDIFNFEIIKLKERLIYLREIYRVEDNIESIDKELNIIIERDIYLFLLEELENNRSKEEIIKELENIKEKKERILKIYKKNNKGDYFKDIDFIIDIIEEELF